MIHHIFKKQSIFNIFGLYTKKQVSELEERINELWEATNHAASTIEVYANMHRYEANPDWEPPVYLRDGGYTMDKRLADIRRHSEILRQCGEEIKKVMFK